MSTSLIDFIRQELAAKDVQIPPFHPVALKLQKTLGQTDFTVDLVVELINSDQYLASQILRLSNSAFFRGLSRVTTVRDALVRLGANQVVSVAMMASNHDMYMVRLPGSEDLPSRLWEHAVATAMGSQWTAKRLGFFGQSDEAFLAGLLHDIGSLFILIMLEQIHVSSDGKTLFSPEMVIEVIDTLHPAVGHELMAKWELPELYADIVRDHHGDELDGGNLLLCIVRLVNQVSRKLGFGIHHEPGMELAMTEEARILGMGELMLAELEIYMEDQVPQVVKGMALDTL